MILGNETALDSIKLSFVIESKEDIAFQMFYSDTQAISPEKSQIIEYKAGTAENQLEFNIPNYTNSIRLDFATAPSELALSQMQFNYNGKMIPISMEYILDNQIETNMLESLSVQNDKLMVIANGNDPYVLVDISAFHLNKWISEITYQQIFTKKVILCVILDIILILIYIFASKALALPIDLYHNKKLIYKLAKNDFKTKYAGSYFGVIWAFVQPVVTILLYWFVFQVGLRATSVSDFPFVLWLIAGLVPWFFFSDGVNYGTNALVEYSYLVKKVVFNISILPMVKILSAFFVHLFFLGIMLVIYTILGHPPTIYWLQIFYYTLCIVVVTLAIAYITSSIILFFRDMGQIINILLQIGIWMTPIMWNITIIPESFRWIFKVNPMFYIVRGYRDALIEKVWFYNRIEDFALFWGSMGIILVIGMLVFKRLKPHFADVL